MVGLIIFGAAVLLSLVWLWAGGMDYIEREQLDLFDEEDKNEIL